ncbi:MAG: DHHA1 domain-containing protein, partial [Terriglobales bacterium]
TVDSSGGMQVFAGAGWHRGVLGIAASRVLAASGRAVLIIALADGLAYGSGRAPAGVALLEMLEGCSELFDRFGGHAQAVGFTMAAEKLGALEAYLRQAAAPAAAVPAAPAHTQAFELSLGELTPQACQELARMAPFGEGNPEPEFQARGVRLVAAPQVLKEKHLKLAVEQDGVRHTALYWNFPHPEMAALGAGAKLDLVFGVETSRHDRYGERTQLMVRRLYAAADSSLAAAGGSVIA